MSGIEVGMQNVPVPGDEEPGPRPGGPTPGTETAPLWGLAGPDDAGGSDAAAYGPPGGDLGMPGDGLDTAGDPYGPKEISPDGFGQTEVIGAVPGAGGGPYGPGVADDPYGVAGLPDDDPGVPADVPADLPPGVPAEVLADLPPVSSDAVVEVVEEVPGDVPLDAPAGPAAPEGPSEPRAARGTTIALVAALVTVVVMSGVLGAVAVLMTRNPDAPPLKQTPVHTLSVPVHFAPVTGVRPAPCEGTDAIPDDKGTTCYLLDPGVTVKTVQKIEEVPDNDGTYSVRLVLSPSSREEIAQLTRDTVKQQLAVVVGEKVVAAPRVAQEITQDSLGIAGFDKAQADAIIGLLTGGSAPAGQQPESPPGAGQPDGTQQGGTQPGGTQPDGTQQGGTQPGGTQPDGTQQGGTQQGGTQPGLDQSGTNQNAPQPGSTPPGVSQQNGGQGTISSGSGTGAAQPGATQATLTSGGAAGGNDVRYASCKEAKAHGAGPYTKGRHPEYYWYVDVDHDGVACDPDDMV
ncbi:excalibur calcium-binding domain-containing protein [Microbispora sp. NBC_01189]|uniref:SecDF P1 head subdomain-containing protein n=1 Tax=Microbispora sp. NBC_01189 TaxID=2903583 RepID=UPI002E11E279|nr:excalibur calcium-binding domain-containing protein [Microbispora sp. NBC_01189]